MLPWRKSGRFKKIYITLNFPIFTLCAVWYFGWKKIIKPYLTAFTSLNVSKFFRDYIKAYFYQLMSEKKKKKSSLATKWNTIISVKFQWPCMCTILLDTPVYKAIKNCMQCFGRFNPKINFPYRLETIRRWWPASLW